VDNIGDQVIDSTGTSSVQSSISYVLGEGLRDLYLMGSDPINGTGNASNNVLYGYYGDLYGSALLNTGANVLAGWLRKAAALVPLSNLCIDLTRQAARWFGST
jgi:hypothetical protein